jgi:hypothetical protein
MGVSPSASIIDMAGFQGMHGGEILQDELVNYMLTFRLNGISSAERGKGCSGYEYFSHQGTSLKYVCKR